MEEAKEGEDEDIGDVIAATGLGVAQRGISRAISTMDQGTAEFLILNECGPQISLAGVLFWEALGITDLETILQTVSLNDASFISIAYQPPIHATVEQELDIHRLYTWAQFCKLQRFLSDDGQDFEIPDPSYPRIPLWFLQVPKHLRSQVHRQAHSGSPRSHDAVG